jgi:hypothetical protein
MQIADYRNDGRPERHTAWLDIGHAMPMSRT